MNIKRIPYIFRFSLRCKRNSHNRRLHVARSRYLKTDDIVVAFDKTIPRWETRTVGSPNLNANEPICGDFRVLNTQGVFVPGHFLLTDFDVGTKRPETVTQ